MMKVFANLLYIHLKSQDLDAKGFAKPSLFWKELEKEVPSLILLDIMLPEEGWDFYSEKAESKAGYQEASYNHADCKGKRV